MDLITYIQHLKVILIADSTFFLSVMNWAVSFADVDSRVYFVGKKYCNAIHLHQMFPEIDRNMPIK